MKITFPPRPDLPSLGEPGPVSKSPLWQIQEDFFRSQGVAAWDRQTPYFVTNSAVAAQTYAELILAFVRDAGPWERPLTILELGTGLGRLGFLLCRELERQRDYFPTQPLRLVLSDIAPANVSFWEGHLALQRYDWLDFACYHPLRDETVELRRAGHRLEPGPLVVIANYVFDAMPHDEFQIRFKRLLECNVELFRSREPQFPDRADIRDITCHRTYRTVSPDYYAEPSWNRLLEEYLREVTLGAVTIPVGALTCLDRLRTLSDGNLLLVASDRAFTTPATLAALQQHPYDTHGGCFSHYVNFHALGRGFPTWLHTTHASREGVHTMAASPLADLPLLTWTFRERVDREGRINVSSDLMALGFEERTELEEARGLVALLRQNLADPNYVAACAKRLLATVKHLPEPERQDLADLLGRAGDSFYDFPGAVDLPYLLARLYAALGRHREALVHVDQALSAAPQDRHLQRFRQQTLEWLGHGDPEDF